MADVIKILIADDHMVVRRGLRSLLIPRNGMQVIGEAVDGDEAIALAKKLNPDVILMDMVMPNKDGIAAIKAIRQFNPAARILVLTSFGDEQQVSKAIAAGALGYLLKDSSPAQLFQAIQTVASGNFSLSQSLSTKLIQGMRRPTDQKALEEKLTARELEVLKSIARGLSNQEIGDELSIGINTVRSYVSILLTKLDCTNRTQLALFAIERGITDPNRQ